MADVRKHRLALNRGGGCDPSPSHVSEPERACFPDLCGYTRADGAPLECVMEHKYHDDHAAVDGCGLTLFWEPLWMNPAGFCPLIDL